MPGSLGTPDEVPRHSLSGRKIQDSAANCKELHESKREREKRKRKEKERVDGIRKAHNRLELTEVG